jgi:UDP-GlcNAc:undecaprenyl-phosphate GlcNAc-1-phosphate transferase
VIEAVHLPYVIAVPLTVVALVGLVNAINMLDGLDGLAGGVSVAMLSWLVVLATLQGQGAYQLITVVSVAATAAFLLLNGRWPWRHRAEVFLGDAGSMSLGLIVGWSVIGISQAENPVVSPMAYLWIVALPVMDTLSLTVRRLLRGRHPFIADRDHIHHLFLRAGFTPGGASYCLVAISLAVGGAGVTAALAGVPDWLLGVSLAGLISLHYVFVRYAWRTMKALGRLNRAYHRLEDHKSCRGAVAGLYVLVFCAPLHAPLAAVGLAGVCVATLGAWRAFLADIKRTPVAWLSLGVATYILARVLTAGADMSQSVTQLLPLTGLLSLPVGWWLARLWLHWRWLLACLIGGVGVAFVSDARWEQLREGGLASPLAWGADAEMGIAQVVVLVMLLAVILGASQRLGRGWRSRFTLLAALSVAVPLVIVLIGSFYATAWIGAVAGILVLGIGAATFGYGRRQWCSLAGGVGLVMLVAIGSWQIISAEGRVGAALREPIQAAMLHLAGEPEAARAVHETTSQRLRRLGDAVAATTEYPVFGDGRVRLDAEDEVGVGRHPYSSLLGIVVVAFGVTGLVLFSSLFLGLSHAALTATQHHPRSATWSLGLLAVYVATVTVLALDVHVEQAANRFMLVLLMGAGFGMAFDRTAAKDACETFDRRGTATDAPSHRHMAWISGHSALGSLGTATQTRTAREREDDTGASGAELTSQHPVVGDDSR